MTEPFDPYQKWLGIYPKDQPPNCYRLLGIDLFVSDLDVIENAAHRQMAHVRTFGMGEHAALSQKLLNEIAKAKVTLLNPEKKTAYDRRLRAKLTPARVVPPARTRPQQPPSAKPVAVTAAPISVDPQVSTPPVRRSGKPKQNRNYSLTIGALAGAVVLLGLGFTLLRRGDQPNKVTNPTAPGQRVARAETNPPTVAGSNDSVPTPPVTAVGSVPELPVPTNHQSPTTSPKLETNSGPLWSGPAPTSETPQPSQTPDSSPSATTSTTTSETSKETGEPASAIISNSLGMTLVAIPAGKFMMGSAADDPLGQDDERPQREVTISQPFYIGLYEVQQSELDQMMGKPSAGISNAAPAVNVTWEDANEFCRRLSVQENQLYRLPSEAEWEYACRLGMRASPPELEEVAWFKDNSDGHVHPVGQLQPNRYGIYDLFGNVDEWCQDLYDGTYYQTGPTVDPVRREQSSDVVSSRILRGGKATSRAEQCRIAFRGAATQSVRSDRIGFRVVRVIQGDVQVAPLADDESADSDAAQDPFWPELAPLLAARNYDGATQQIEQWLADPANEAHTAQLQAEQQDLALLKKLQAAVQSGLQQLSPGEKIRIRGIGNMEFVRYDPAKNMVVSRIGGAGRTSQTSVNQLRPDEWILLAQRALASQPNADLIKAIFHTVDENGDAEEAQRLLISAASAGADVDRYLARLDEQLGDESTPQIPEIRSTSKEANSKRQKLREKFAPEATKIGDHYYQTFYFARSWTQAMAACASMGGYLACFETREEQNSVAGLTNGKAVWVGGFQHPSGILVWLNKDEISSDRFLEIRPGHKYVAFVMNQNTLNTRSLNGILRPARVERIQGFVCEWEH